MLRHEPVSADVTSTTPVRLLRYPAELFPTALTECEPLREKLLGRLAQDLQRSTTDAWDLFKREQAFADLASVEGFEDSMVVASPSALMRATRLRSWRRIALRSPATMWPGNCPFWVISNRVAS